MVFVLKLLKTHFEKRWSVVVDSNMKLKLRFTQRVCCSIDSTTVQTRWREMEKKHVRSAEKKQERQRANCEEATRNHFDGNS